MVTLSDATVLHDLLKLANIATVIINEHQDDRGQCVVCGSAWPCERVATAEHNIELL